MQRLIKANHTNVFTEKLGKGVEFERIRRITGYLGTVDRFNKAKQAEVKDRVKHK